jgi:lipid-A-disaccharide synthase
MALPTLIIPHLPMPHGKLIVGLALPLSLSLLPLVPELIQEDAKGENIAKHAMAVLNGDNQNLAIEFKKIHQQLNLNASTESARLIGEFINE